MRYNELMRAMLYCPNFVEGDILTMILQHNGLEVLRTNNLHESVETWPEHPLELAMICLPEEVSESLQVMKSLRMHTVVPVIAISDRLRETDQVALMEAGVDLIVFRPYSAVLLSAQIQSLLRRSGNMPFFSLPSLVQGGIKLDPTARTVQVDGKEPRHLTQLEFRLLYNLMTHADKVIPSEQIVESVWGYEGESNKELVRGLVQRLRSKLEPDPQNPTYLCTELGVGYYFTTRKETPAP